MVGRALAILETVAASSCAVPLASLARSTGVPKPSALRIANDLVTRGLLARTDEGFTTGSHLRALGALALDQAAYRGAAGPLLWELHVRTSQVAFLAVVDGPLLVLVDAVAGGLARRTPLPPTGGWAQRLDRPDVLTTAAGRVVLADRPEAARSIAARGAPRMTPYTVTAPRPLGDHLRRVHDDGVALEREQRRVGWSCVAAPVRCDGRVVAVVGLAGRTTGWSPERLAPVLRAGAVALSAAAS